MAYQWAPVTVRGLKNKDLVKPAERYPHVLNSHDVPLLSVNGHQYSSDLVFVGRTQLDVAIAVFSYEAFKFPNPRTALGYFAFWRDCNDADWQLFKDGLAHDRPEVTGAKPILECESLEVATEFMLKIAAELRDQLETE